MSTTLLRLARFAALPAAGAAIVGAVVVGMGDAAYGNHQGQQMIQADPTPAPRPWDPNPRGGRPNPWAPGQRPGLPTNFVHPAPPPRP